MSGRQRRSETLWDNIEERTSAKDLHSSVCQGSSPKWSNSETNDGMMPGNFSGRPSWEPLQGKGIVPKDDDINRGRPRMQRDPTINEWEKKCSMRPSDDSYGLPYRGLDRGVGGSAHMNIDRSKSPYRSRSRGSTRVRSRSPFCDDRRESDEHADIRNNPRVSSRPCKHFAAGDCRKGSQCRFFHQEIPNSKRGGSQVDNNVTESWSSRSDYSGGAGYSDNGNSSDRWRNMGSDGYKKDTRLDEEARDAYRCKDFMKGWCHRGESCGFQHHVASGDDYHRDDRNLYDGQDRRRQSNRSSIPCKFFSAGKCIRNDCKFSHDVPVSGRYDERSHDNVRGCNLGNKNRIWNDQQLHDVLNASDFSDIAKSKFGEKNKPWNGQLWDEVESGGFDERSRHNIHGHTSDDKNRTWDASGFSDVVKSKHNSDDKKKLWDGPSWVDVDASRFPNVGKSNPDLDNKNRSWNGPSWDEVIAAGFSNVSKTCHDSEDKKSRKCTSSGIISTSGCSYGENSGKNIDGKTKSWNGSSWDEVSKSGYSDIAKSSGGDVDASCFPNVGKSNPNLDDKNKSWNGPSWDGVIASGFSNVSKTCHNSEDSKKSWNGTSSGTISASGCSYGENSGKNIDGKTNSWNGPSWDELSKSGYSDIAKSSGGDVEASCFPNVGKSNPNLDNKNRSWNGTSWDEVIAAGFSNVSKTCHNSEDSKKSWNGTSSGTISASGCSYGENSGKNIEGKTKSWNGPSWDEVSKSGYSDVGKSSGGDVDASCIPNVGKSNPNLDNKNRPWNGPSWDEVIAAGFSNVSKTCHSSEDIKKSWNGTSSGTIGASGCGENSGKNIDGKTKSWNEVSKSGYSDVGKSSWGDGTSAAMHQISQTRKWDDPGLNEAYEKNDNLGLQSQTLDGQAQHVMPQALGSRLANATTVTMPEVARVSLNQRQGEHNVVNLVNDSDANDAKMVSKDANLQFLTTCDINPRPLSYLNGTEQSQHMLLSNLFNGPKLNAQVQGMFLHMDSQKQMEIQNKGGQPLNSSEIDVPQVTNDMKETSVTSELAPQVNSLPAPLPKISQKEQLTQVYTEINLTNALNFLKSLPNSAYDQDTKAKEQQNSARSMEPVGNPEGQEQEEGNTGNDEKAMRQFKVALVEFVKAILKPMWKEGKMSKEVHKSVVKKVIDKVTSTIQGVQVPRTQGKIEQYLAYSKPKITKLVEAYVERLKKEA